MNKRVRTVRITLVALLSLVVVTAGALVVLINRLDPNDYKPLLIEIVQKKTQRTLTIPGQIRLTLFPSPVADLGRLTLSEQHSAAPFIAIDSAKISLQWLPLWRRELVVDKIDMDGLQATLRRIPDTGGPDADTKDQTSHEAGPVRFDLDRLTLRNASVQFDDSINRRQISLSKVNLVTGRLVHGAKGALTLSAHIDVDRPAVAAQLQLSADYALDLLHPRLVLSDSEMALKGSLAGRDIRARITTVLPVELENTRMQAPRFMVKASLPNPAGGAMPLTASGNVLVKVDDDKVDDDKVDDDKVDDDKADKKNTSVQLSGQLDDSRFDAKLAFTAASSSPLRFDIAINKLDLARYRPVAAAVNPVPSRHTQSADTGGFDLSAFSALRAEGRLTIEALQTGTLNVTKLKAVLNAQEGQLMLSPLSARLYGGTLNGSFSVTASKTPRLTMKQSLSAIQLAPLLKDVIDKAPIEGVGNLTLDLVTQGNSFAALKKNLSGQARLSVGDGAIRGINIAHALREAKNKFKALQTLQQGQSAQFTGSAGIEKTDFSALTATVLLANGLARNDDLAVKAPFLRVSGKGQANLVTEKLDYLITATVVQTLQGQGGPELQALKGLTVPVRLAGPFDAVTWQLDLNALATQGLRQKLEQKKEAVRAQVKDKLKEQFDEKLKGLFGR